MILRKQLSLRRESIISEHGALLGNESFSLEPQIVFNQELPEHRKHAGDGPDEDLDYVSGFTSLRGAIDAENQQRACFGPGYD